MSRQNESSDLSIAGSARAGIRAGVRAAILYAALFTFYALLRSSGTIAFAGELDAGLVRTIAGSGITLTIAAAAFTVVILLPVAMLGMLTGVLTYAILRLGGQPKIPGFGSAAGATAAAILCGVIALAGADLLGGSMPEQYPQTWWFWLGLPGLVWLVTGSLIGRRLGDSGGGSATITRFENDNGTDSRTPAARSREEHGSAIARREPTDTEIAQR